jgi:hypothetical protein
MRPRLPSPRTDTDWRAILSEAALPAHAAAAPAFEGASGSDGSNYADAIGAPLDEARRLPIQIEHRERLDRKPAGNLVGLAVDCVGRPVGNALPAPADPPSRPDALRFDELGAFRPDLPRHGRSP